MCCNKIKNGALVLCAAAGSAILIYATITLDIALFSTTFFLTFVSLCLIEIIPNKYFKIEHDNKTQIQTAIQGVIAPKVSKGLLELCGRLGFEVLIFQEKPSERHLIVGRVVLNNLEIRGSYNPINHKVELIETSNTKSLCQDDIMFLLGFFQMALPYAAQKNNILPLIGR
jgi:hypothetical protein